MAIELRVTITDDGGLQFIYSDEPVMRALLDCGEYEIVRASHVEPASSIGWECGGWIADMRPSKGPLLYAGTDARGVKQAYETRQEALDAEIAWLRQYKGL